jgi:hypothetical protein
MASSHRALAASLSRVAERLRNMLAGTDRDPLLDFAADLEEDEEALAATDREEGREPESAKVRAELALVEGFVARLGALDTDAKARALLDAVRVLDEEAVRGERSGKLLIFTESLATQAYLRELLMGAGVPDSAITLFRGQNDSPRAAEALARWYEEIGVTLGAGARPSREVAMRLALVHEFKHASRVLIATEAGAKGLNLQFCDTLVNYDLPWNPQRIEQRIGRCHRYGQTRDVTVINFLASDNAADRLTFEILSRKLDLFGTVLDASDQVLYEPGRSASDAVLGALSADFATEVRRIYESARSMEQIEAELSRLGSQLVAQRYEAEAAHRRTAGLIESRFDAAVRQAFRHIAEELPGHLRELDRDLERLVCDYLESENVRYRRSASSAGGAVLEIEPGSALPAPYHEGGRVAVGGSSSLEHGEPLHIGHPLVRLATEAARAATRERFRVSMGGGEDPEVARWRGQRGRLRVVKLHYAGFEPVDRLLPVVVLEAEGEQLAASTALRLLAGPLAPALDLRSGVSDAALEEAVEEAVFLDEREVSELEHAHFERAMAQLERFIDDRVSILKRSRSEVAQRIRSAQHDRAGATGSESRSRIEALIERAQLELETLDLELARLEARNDSGYQRWRERAYERRYAPPRREAIIDVEFVIG